ncbi:bifunctional metallophosphatase/5'-nucleotidase [Chlorobaculum thiosulfatiphilum]|uniref:Bifunctional metallophosphatase/5'-nucleotidase n=1 Tax=Chlorobaculum thiosulfatiphilum TaxID=115852 RepID=A0A5C4S2Z3_CHLTI|nr:bifunctional UDP-sugar hydrolase/5'-nucleotidase [Chlorobaculum thiosulfatiphilum]TNJ37507.1 bifunctional metallophosphatase/5'-nucleotidase [Chlorobaculum thiosulfatiphilum]
MIDRDSFTIIFHADSGIRQATPRLRTLPRRFVLLLALASLFAGLHLVPATALAEPARLTVLFTSDLHSYLSPHREMASDGSVREVGGYARLAGAIDEERSRSGGEALVVDAGDFTQGTLYHTLLQEEAFELRLMGAMGYDAATFGNHDFDFRPSGAAAMLRAARAKAATLPRLLISNLHFSESDPADDALERAFRDYPVRGYTVVERAGVRIGIFSVLGRDAAEDASFARPVTFTDQVEAARKTVKMLKEREKVDLIVCLSHSGTNPEPRHSEDEKLAALAPGIDLIVSGHTHTVLHSPIMVGRTAIVSAGSYGAWLGVLDLMVEKGRDVQVAGYRLRKIDASTPEEPEIARMIDGFRSIVEERYLAHFGYRFDQVLARQPFDGQSIDEAYANPGETGRGNLVTDAYRFAVERAEGGRRHIDVAVDVLGCIRASLYRGDIRVSDVFQTASLGPVQYGYCGNTIIVLYLTGRDLKNLLEVHTSIAPSKKDALLSVSGIRFRHNPRRMIFDRVTSVEVEGADKRFRPVERERLYSVAINAYLASLIDLVGKKSHGILKITPRDETGNPVNAKDEPRLTVTRNGEPLREWVALAEYLSSFPEKDGIATVPERYARPEGRIVAEASWNPVALVAGGNWLTIAAAALFVAAVMVVILLTRRVVARRDHALSEKQ